MGGEDAVIVGAEDSDPAEVDQDKMNIDKPQENSPQITVDNRSVLYEGDLMILDNVTSGMNTTSLEGLEKEVNLDGAKCFDNDLKQILDQQDMEVGAGVTQSYAIEAPIKCQKNFTDEQKGAIKQLKRKRVSLGGNLNLENKEPCKSECLQELDELFEYFKEVSGLKVQNDVVACSINLMVAVLLEEQDLPLSKLVEEIYDKLKGRESLTLATLRGSVLLVGQRIMYGLSDADADVLEDDSKSCLWCWETRDLKLLPASFRGVASIRRFARKKINERISAISGMLNLISSSKRNDSYQSDLFKASKKLKKILDKQAICSLVEKMKLKNSSDMAEKEAKLKEKELSKEMEKSMRSAEKETKKIHRELLKEKLQNEKEMKRMREEAEREEKCHEKEEAELKRQFKKQLEEAAREQRRREKEEAELKKQREVQKQASIMDRFLKSKKNSNAPENSEKNIPIKYQSAEGPTKTDWNMNSATLSMDSVLSQPYDMAIEDLRRLYVASWHKLAHSKRFSYWSARRNPKFEITKEIKLQGSSNKLERFETPDKRCSSESRYDRLVEELEDSFPNKFPCQSETFLASPPICLWRKKLLQFDKSNRPAYYGTWRKKSAAVGPRHPFMKDPELNYDVDSDEEWEEEDPGESLSDCDKDNEEALDEESLKNQDEDESEDGFLVPDGYLSENEGVEIEATSVLREDEANSSLSGKHEDKDEEFRSLLQQQKLLDNLTEKALRKNQPLVIANLNHGKDGMIIAEVLIGKDRIDQICIQALCMRTCPENSITDISVSCDPVCEDQEVRQDYRETTKKMASSSAVISDIDLPEFVKLIQSCPHGMNKVVQVLHQKFPAIPKSQLRNKVRETSDFFDNHWQVRKDILERLGLPFTPDKKSKPEGIAMFFTKRCLPPKGDSSFTESSPEQCSKSKLYNGQSSENAV